MIGVFSYVNLIGRLSGHINKSEKQKLNRRLLICPWTLNSLWRMSTDKTAVFPLYFFYPKIYWCLKKKRKRLKFIEKKWFHAPSVSGDIMLKPFLSDIHSEIETDLPPQNLSIFFLLLFQRWECNFSSPAMAATCNHSCKLQLAFGWAITTLNYQRN